MEFIKMKHKLNFINLLDSYCEFDKVIHDTYQSLGINTSLYESKSPFIAPLINLLKITASNLLPISWWKYDPEYVSECLSIYEDLIFHYSMAKQMNKKKLFLYLTTKQEPIEFLIEDDSDIYDYFTSDTFLHQIIDALDYSISNDIYIELEDE